VLVGREVEQLAVERLLAGARVGDSGVLVISGDPGIGKSALLAHAMAVTSGMRILVARGVDAESEVAFGGLYQLCASLLHLLEELPPPQAEALAVALAMRTGPVPERFAVGAAVLGLLTRAAEDLPLAVFVDDAHLLDESSLQAIGFAARRLLSDPVALVLALRAGREAALSGLPVLRLGPLTADKTRELVHSASIGPLGASRLARFHEATGGNPLAILDLAGEVDRLAAAPPGSTVPLTGELLRAYSRRALDLSKQARSALLLAAADNHDVGALLRAFAAAGLAVDVLAEAEAAGLVRVAAGVVQFHHPLVRAAIYGAAAPADRRTAHRLLSETVLGTELDRRAWHRAEAAFGPDAEAVTLLDQAADAAGRRGANAVASAQLQRAAGLTEDRQQRGQLLCRAGDQAWLAGASAEARGLFNRSLELATSPLAQAQVMGRLGAVEGRCGSLETARDLQLAAAAKAAPVDPEVAALLLADAVETCLYLCDTASALRAAGRLELLTGLGVPSLASRVGGLAAGVAMVLGGSGDLGAELIRTAMAQQPGPAGVKSDREGAGQGDDQWRFRWGLVGPMFLRESGAARKAMVEAVRIVRERAAVGTLPFLLTLIARDDAGSTGWADAEAGYTEAIRLAREAGHDTDLALALAGLAWLEARQGKEEASRRHAAEATDLGALHSAHLATVWAAFAVADLELSLGRTAAAAQAYTHLDRLLGALGVTDPDLSPAPELVECCVQAGQNERALATARDFITRAETKGQPWALARAHRAVGIALGQSSTEVEAEFVAALAFHDRTPDRFESARTQLAHGAWLRRSRRRVDARPVLRAALATFERLGAVPWADRTAAELEATGETAMHRGVGPIAALTPQERQIASLLADGRTTREAAMALFLSPKTVEYHLRHVYAKLGIRSRQELASAMAES
jgi:DNA-binding CsgD family transcriptional regulator